jgi:hypothetical protein
MSEIIEADDPDIEAVVLGPSTSQPITSAFVRDYLRAVLNRIAAVWENLDVARDEIIELQEDLTEISGAVSYSFTGTSLTGGVKWSLAERYQGGETTYTLASDEVEVEWPGLYSVTVSGTLSVADTSAAVNLGIAIRKGGAIDFTVRARRSADDLGAYPVCGTTMLQITDPATEKISITSASADAQSTLELGRLEIRRVG